MTRDDIIRMAEYAGSKQLFQFTAEELERFAAFAVAQERKELSGILLDYARRNDLSDSDKSRLNELLDLIRAWGGEICTATTSEQEKVAAWMRSKSYATGHGDTTEDLLKELEWQVAEREREACAKVCEKMADNIYSNSHEDSQPMPHAVAKFCADAIRARGET